VGNGKFVFVRNEIDLALVRQKLALILQDHKLQQLLLPELFVVGWKGSVFD
jgi:hypothetical protein